MLSSSSFKLNNGLMIPKVGLGTSNFPTFKEVLRESIKAGYRLIDTARIYNNEGAIGEVLEEVIKEGLVKREDLFIITKVWNSKKTTAENDILESLKALRTDYVDAVLVHWPIGGVEEPGSTKLMQRPLHEIWKELEYCVKQGYCKSIGVSNFNVQILLDLWSYAEIKPSINEVELHPFLQQSELVAFCQRFGIHMVAYSPLVRGGTSVKKVIGNVIDAFSEPALIKIAENVKKSLGQVILNWNITRGVTVVPKTTNPSRLLENLQAADFALSEDDMNTIKTLDRKTRVVDPLHETDKGKFDFIPVFD